MAYNLHRVWAARKGVVSWPIDFAHCRKAIALCTFMCHGTQRPTLRWGLSEILSEWRWKQKVLQGVFPPDREIEIIYYIYIYTGRISCDMPPAQKYEESHLIPSPIIKF